MSRFSSFRPLIKPSLSFILIMTGFCVMAADNQDPLTSMKGAFGALKKQIDQPQPKDSPAVEAPLLRQVGASDRLAKEKAAQEQAVAKADATAAAERKYETDKTTEKNFEIKGLTLKLTKAQVLSQINKTAWTCAAKSDPAFEHCEVVFGPETCWAENIVLANGEILRDGLGRPVTGKKCKRDFANPDTFGGNAKQWSTMGGERVIGVGVLFFNDAVAEYNFVLEKASRELFVGLRDKFGSESKNTNTYSEWVGRDVSLAVLMDSPRLILRNNAITAIYKESAKQSAIAQKNDEQAKQKAQSQQKRNDL